MITTRPMEANGPFANKELKGATDEDQAAVSRPARDARLPGKS